MIRRNTESCIAEIEKIHPDKFTFDNFEYLGCVTKSFVTCKIHGDFLTHWNLLQSGKGCPTCGHENTAKFKRLTTKSFIQKAKDKYGDKFTYLKTKYGKSNNDELIVTCDIHHDILVKPVNFLKKGTKFGCELCGIESSRFQKVHDKPKFIEKARLVHGDTYDYSLVEYINNETKVSIICPTHGVFRQKPSNHLVGKSCHKCAKYGFDTSKSGYLYVLQSDSFIKIGITNTSPESKRILQINNGSPEHFTLIKSYCFDDGTFISDIETTLLRYFRTVYKNPDTKFDGYTETFVTSDIALFLDYIDKVVKLLKH